MQKNILVFKKVTQEKKRENISKSETTTLTYFDNLKKTQQDQGSKDSCYRKFYVTDKLKSHNYCVLL